MLGFSVQFSYFQLYELLANSLIPHSFSLLICQKGTLIFTTLDKKNKQDKITAFKDFHRVKTHP